MLKFVVVLKKVGDKIKKLREQKKLTQANMGEELGINATSFSKIENGKINIPLKRLFEIADILEVPVATFFEEQVPSFKESKNPNYGYASKSEVDNLSHLVQSLIKEIERLRAELPKSPSSKKKKK